MGSMRLLPMGLALVALVTPVFGQRPAPEKPGSPLLPSLPRPYLLKPPSSSVPGLTTPGEGLPFRHWRDLLAKNETAVRPRPINPKLDSTASGWAAPGHCSIPLIEIPLPAHYDERMVRMMGPHPDDKMAITPPPTCPLRGAGADQAKRK